MKKNIIYTMLFAAAAFILTSCGDDESAGLSRITYYPTIELEGGSTIFVTKGTAWKDPGYISMMGTEDVTDKVTINSNVDMNTGGVYTVTYTTAKNSDGFGSSTSRTVYVWDPANGLDGLYTCTADGYRIYNGNQVGFNMDFTILLIRAEGDNVYVDDFFGGWYSQRAGYGDNYKMGGKMKLAADGTLSLVSSLVPGWGDSLDDLSGTYDAEAKTFHVISVYNGKTMYFHMNWVKQ